MIQNRTPHEIVLLRPRQGPWDGPDAALCPEGHWEIGRLPSLEPARASATRRKVDEVDAIAGGVPWLEKGKASMYVQWIAPVFAVEFGEVTGLPEPAPDVFHVVSRIAAEAARAHGRTTDDLLIPDGVVRGADGQPIGCTGFARL